MYFEWLLIKSNGNRDDIKSCDILWKGWDQQTYSVVLQPPSTVTKRASTDLRVWMSPLLIPLTLAEENSYDVMMNAVDSERLYLKTLKTSVRVE